MTSLNNHIKTEVLDDVTHNTQEKYNTKFIYSNIKIEPIENEPIVSQLKLETVLDIKEEDEISDCWKQQTFESDNDESTAETSPHKLDGIGNTQQTLPTISDDVQIEQGNIHFISLKIFQETNPQEKEKNDNKGATNSGDKNNSVVLNAQKERKRHLCDVCQKAFTYPIDVVRHKRVHTGEKPYGCDLCGKHFAYQTDLSRHKLIHTGEKPYVCETCNKGFVQRVGLVRHTRTHTGERPYECDVCYKAFTHSSHLADHRRIHTGEKPYVCNICSKSFRQQVNLIQHMRGHTGERPYACEICQKTFSRSNHLSTHKRTHLGIKPYSCLQCNKAFTQLSHLNRHNVSYHTNK